ncbi:MAG: substrate-binding domain-containing protein [Planctomycetia bacterium]|nr:substrate-binding domain-containing protein [Planctomycetia bacterium]
MSSPSGCSLLLPLALLGLVVPFDLPDLQPKLAGELRIDGSTQVYFIAEAGAGAFQKQFSDVEVRIGKQGTNVGLALLASGDIDICTASRSIQEEEAGAIEAGYIEVQIAWDAVAVVVHKDNTWVDKLTLEQLQAIWRPEDNGVKNAKKWSDLDAKWPKEDLKLSGLAQHSQLGRQFCELISGEGGAIREDYTTVGTTGELPRILDDKHALGFISQTVWRKHSDQLKLVAVGFKPGKSPVSLTPESLDNGSYPLVRPFFLYVRKDALQKPQVLGFLRFLLQRPDLVREGRFFELSAARRTAQEAKLIQALRSE